MMGGGASCLAGRGLRAVPDPRSERARHRDPVPTDGLGHQVRLPNDGPLEESVVPADEIAQVREDSQQLMGLSAVGALSVPAVDYVIVHGGHVGLREIQLRDSHAAVRSPSGLFRLPRDDAERS